MKNLRLGAFLVVFAVAGQASAFGGYNPTQGRPWSSGSTTSMVGFDWSHWGVGVGQVINRSTPNRTWTVQLDSVWQTNMGQGAGSIGCAMLSGTSLPTTAQVVVNDIYGARIAVSGVVSSTSSSVWRTYNVDAGFSTSQDGHVVYVNYVLPANGAIGALGPLKLLY